MAQSICCGTDPLTGEFREIAFERTIQRVRPGRPSGASLIAPAFIDVQVNGFAGVDFNSPLTSAEQISFGTREIRKTGVARYFPTVITGSPENMTGALKNLALAKESIPERESIEAFHVEGPHIWPEDGPRGAHPREWVRPPDVEEFRRMQDAARGHVRLVTVSPHWPGAPAYIEQLVDLGVVISIGHTHASAEQIDDAVRAGATMSTHIGNGADGMLRRHPNYLWDQLADDRLSASMIVDGIHLGASFLKVALRAKTPARAVLVTDASAPVGCAPGRYRLGQQEVDLTEDGRVVLAGQDRLAGSALKMHDAVANLCRMTNAALSDALTMASVNPARLCHIAGRQAGLAVGDTADLVLFERGAGGELHIKELYVAGERVPL